jgi:hypothetical protein
VGEAKAQGQSKDKWEAWVLHLSLPTKVNHLALGTGMPSSTVHTQ